MKPVSPNAARGQFRARNEVISLPECTDPLESFSVITLVHELGSLKERANNFRLWSPVTSLGAFVESDNGPSTEPFHLANI